MMMMMAVMVAVIMMMIRQILGQPRFSCIEKIKTTGATYMTASGLVNTDSCTQDNHHVIATFGGINDDSRRKTEGRTVSYSIGIYSQSSRVGRC